MRRIAIVGGGLVGLATARALQRRLPGVGVVVLEKEEGVARHQSGRNSGVLHAGLSYRPGSLKARLAAEGRRAIVAFCGERGIACEPCGMVVVAPSEAERPRLEALRAQGAANGLAGVRVIEADELRAREPHAAGVAALLVPEEGIVDFPAVAAALAREVAAAGGEVLTGAPVRRLWERVGGGWMLDSDMGPFEADFLVNCAGLQCDRVARMAGVAPLPVRIVPFRGEFWRLRPERRHLARHLVYPLADPRYPFLGVHFTRRVGGAVDVGPNAVLAWGREAYGRGTSRADEGVGAPKGGAPGASLRDTWEMLRYGGFWRMAWRHLGPGLAEWRRSLSRAAFARAAARLVPELRADDLVPGGVGVRAQAVDARGALVDDFVLVEGRDALHVLNAPSPAATACLAIGEEIAGRVGTRWKAA